VLVVVITYLLLRFRMSIVAMSPSVVEFCSAAMLCLLHWIWSRSVEVLAVRNRPPGVVLYIFCSRTAINY
jgi:hypothetical protein